MEQTAISKQPPSRLEHCTQVFCDHFGLREATGSWSRLHCSRQEEGTGEWCTMKLLVTLCSEFLLIACLLLLLCCCRFCLTVFQNSYEVFQLRSLSFFIFPWENLVFLAHHFAGIIVHIKLLTSQYNHVALHDNFPYSSWICYNLSCL